MANDRDQMVESLVERMTPAEKLAQLGGIFPFHFRGPAGDVDPAAMREVIPDGIGQVSGAAMLGGDDPRQMARAANAVQRYHVEETRLGIPAILHNEALCGLMYGPATTFPTAINLAATWEPELVGQMTDLTRMQMRAVGIHQALSPVMDVARDARWGRVHETYGEDPVLCAAFAVAFVAGLQGDDLRDGAIATAKHFLGYGLSEAALNQAAVHLGPRELYEVFALPFEAAIREAGLASVMNSYSEIDGVPVAASREVLSTLLRQELGFEGFVVADYGSVAYNLTKHCVAVDRADAALQSLVAGLDVELPQLQCFPALREHLESGELDGAIVDTAVARVLYAKVDLGLFDDPYRDEDDAARAYSLPEAGALAKRITERSLVLLDNDGTLPLAGGLGRIAVVGPFADSLRLMFAAYSAAGNDELNCYLAAGLSGTMAGIDIDTIDIGTIGEVIFGTRERGIDDDVIEGRVRKLYPDMPTLAEAVEAQCGDAVVHRAAGCHFLDPGKDGFAAAIDAARAADVAICAVGEKTGWVGQATGGEGRDRVSLDLPGEQAELVRQLVATGTPVVVVLCSGRPLVVPEGAAAQLWAGCPGLHGPQAIADVLCGRVEPSGRLPVSFPRGAGQTPVYASHKIGSGASDEAAPGHVDCTNRPRFAFGAGLGYGSVDLSDISVSETVVLYDETVTISCKATNPGTAPASEVVQLYARDRQASVTRPARQLAGFTKVELAPGESRRIDFYFAISQLALLDRAYRLVVEPGEIDLMIGRAADRIDLTTSITIDGDVTELECRGPFYAEAEVS